MMDLNMDIYELGLSKRSLYALNRNGITTVKELVLLNHYELSHKKGVGENIISDVMMCIKKHGLHLGMKI